MMPRRPLRSVFLGNPRYLSVYALGVSQAMGMMGHWHRSVSLFDGDDVAKQVAEMAPDVIWTHMALWPPPPDQGALTAARIATILAYWRRRGTAVYLHDGDPKEREMPAGVDIGSAFSIALINRTVPSTHWGIPAIRWPYAAMVQREPAAVTPEWMYDLAFAGILKTTGLYTERTALVYALQEAVRLSGGRMLITNPQGGDVNSRMLVADVAASANAVLGFARPEVDGWIDTRVFQYPGSGGVLIHDDAGEFLEPDVHYLKFDRSNAVESVLQCVARAKTEGSAIRERVFEHVQVNHTWVNRCTQALAAFYGR